MSDELKDGASPVTPRLSPAVPVVGVVLVGGLLFAGFGPRAERAAQQEKQHRLANGPRRVVVASAVRGPASGAFSLPGTAAPLRATVVTARGTGFVQKYLVDLGDTVKAGQVLALLEAPEVDEEVRRARARVDEAEANVELARSGAERSRRLSEQGAVSKQQAEEAQIRLTTAVAAVETARAELLRLGALKGFGRVVAPFSGVVTRRFVEQGALVSDRVPLFEVAQTDALRVTVDVPQWLAGDVKVGQVVKVAPSQRPQQTVEARVTRSAQALDAATRTLRIEALVEQPGAILANAFVSVTFEVERSSPPVVVPAAALMARADGLRVVVVRDKVLRLTPVTVARDLGRTVELASGLEAGAQVVVNPPDDVDEGEAVEVVVRPVADAGVGR